jgi:hypothetical protein
LRQSNALAARASAQNDERETYTGQGSLVSIGVASFKPGCIVTEIPHYSLLNIAEGRFTPESASLRIYMKFLKAERKPTFQFGIDRK